MRILFTADPEVEVPPTLYGGIERIVASLIKAFRARGVVVGLVAHANSTCEVESFFPWPRNRSRGAASVWKNTAALRDAVARFRPDVLHSFSRLAYLLPLLRSGYPKVMSFQRLPTCRTVRLAAVLARDRTLAFTGCSEYIAAQGRRCAGDWKAVPNFVDTEVFRSSNEIPPAAPLLFLSRVERVKGAHSAIRIANLAGRRLIIAGNHSATPEDAEYWKREIEPNLSAGRIDYVGPVDDATKGELLRSAAALLVPIEWDEPFGIVFAEALACGTPVVSCPRGALPEIVRQGVDGFLVRTDTEAVDAIRRLSEISRSACRERAIAKYSLKVVADQYFEFYETYLNVKVDGNPTSNP